MSIQVTPLKGEKIEKFISHFIEWGQEPRARFGKTGCVFRAMFEDTLPDVKNFTVREEDVWVVTPPKCGTTWTQEMVWLLLNNFDYERAKTESLQMRSPYLELSRIMPEKVRDEYLHGLDTLEYAANLPSRRCIKSHLPKDLLPDQLWTKKPKIIYVAREPKDAAVSYYYHEKMFESFSGEKEFYFECFYEDLATNMPLWEHILDFWKMKDEPDILFSTYEEMKKDLPAVIRRTANFLNLYVSEEQVLGLTEHLDFKQMTKNDSVNFEDALGQMREIGVVKENEKFIRKGIIGEGRREMSPELASKYDERTRRVFCKENGGCPWNI